MNSLEIKYALLSYFRFKRQCICASECLDNDIMVITKNGYTIDVEIKINKYDLWKGEAKKNKHKLYRKMKNKKDNIISQHCKSSMANKFYICVPTILEKEAKKWINEINSKYGIIRYEPKYYNSIIIAKTAKLLHNEKYDSLKQSIMMRVCSENINLIGKLLSKKIEVKRNE